MRGEASHRQTAVVAVEAGLNTIRWREERRDAHRRERRLVFVTCPNAREPVGRVFVLDAWVTRLEAVVERRRRTANGRGVRRNHVLVGHSVGVVEARSDAMGAADSHGWHVMVEAAVGIERAAFLPGVTAIR